MHNIALNNLEHIHSLQKPAVIESPRNSMARVDLAGGSTRVAVKILSFNCSVA